MYKITVKEETLTFLKDLLKSWSFNMKVYKQKHVLVQFSFAITFLIMKYLPDFSTNGTYKIF